LLASSHRTFLGSLWVAQSRATRYGITMFMRQQIFSVVHF
jgi:hypothetical protein